MNNWLYENFMTLNPEKVIICALEKILMIIKCLTLITIKSRKEVEILGIKIDNNINFNNHIKSICREAGQKLSALLRISSNIIMRQKKLLYKSIIESQFNYCPLVWIFCSRQSNNLIKKIHQWSLSISYKDQETSYHNFLEKHNELTIHQ